MRHHPLDYKLLLNTIQGQNFEIKSPLKNVLDLTLISSQFLLLDPHDNRNSVTAGHLTRPVGQMSSTVQCSEINGETICKRKSSSCAGQYIISNGSCLNPRKVFSQDNKKFVK